MLDVVFQDKHYVAINKPHGLLVHKTKLAAYEDVFALQLIRDQINQKVFPIHRLDRKTSGVLLFALSSEAAKRAQELFQYKDVRKRYTAIVRGYFPQSIYVNYDLVNDSGKRQTAITDFKLLKHSELAIPFGKHSTSRYSLIEAFPSTGRMHQIRKHLNHLRHPIIGDRPHGCSKQNRLFKEKWNMSSMMLHASSLSFNHPFTKEPVTILAKVSSEFSRMQNCLNLE